MHEALTVGPVGEECVVDVGHRVHPGMEADVVPGEPTWVAASVEPFMVLQYDRDVLLIGLDRLQDSSPDSWVLFHDVTLFVGELPRLVQNLRWDPDLSDVMEKASSVHDVERALIQPQGFSNRDTE